MMTYALCLLTDSSCSSNFPSVFDLKQWVLDANINDIKVQKGRQWLIPDITFTCNGSITKWIVGARHQPGKSEFPELQIWRSMDSMIYMKVGFNTLTPNKVNDVMSVHEHISSPLEFQEGDILGLYQPIDTSGMELYYQIFDGPVNYKLNYEDNAVNIETLRPARYDYPLVTVEIATHTSFIIPVISSTLVTVIPISTSQTLLTKSLLVPLSSSISNSPILQEPLKSPSISNSSNSQHVVLPIFAYPVISVAAILIIIAAVITVVMMIIRLCRDKANRNNSVNMQIDQNLSYTVNSL